MQFTSSKIIAEFFAKDTLPPVIVCIGTDKVVGDSLGPTVGTLLTKCYCSPCFVYGTLDRPITALNLTKTANFIRYRHPRQRVLAIDCAVGKASEVGNINLSSGGIKAGSGVGKNIPEIGDFSVTCVIAPKEKAHLLHEVQPKAVFSLAVSVAKTVYDGIKDLAFIPYINDITV